ncbi:exopolyphosphatase [Clostridium tepidiprofundi DSM 19306]|uniref:Exopolyphosphatase n=1 Tax=Clostridium tepidiprofundi DSM 19306 TaxID=1121338 RepID=A0A151B2W2_9CLOT|nr:exopolyphosphatase [Clostridium tepidiprofundi]KYH34092.1 exopolyphosphatase [Clostridium tepidiprofundi DSM 19306]
MKNISIIDIGSNSLRLILVSIFDNGAFKVIDEFKESIRLGSDMKDNCLNENRMSNAIELLKTFKKLSDSVQVSPIIAVATEAVRKAKNKNIFLEKVKNECGIDIKVLTGEEEAYYDYLGAINSINTKDSIIIDIGGSSTELAWIENNTIKESISLPIGAIVLSKKFDINNKLSNKEENQIVDFITKTFNDIPWLKNVKNLPVIGIGGTIRNICKIHRKNIDYPLDLNHNYIMSAKDVNEVYSIVKCKSTDELKKLKGLSKNRADIFAGACCEFNTFIELLDTKHIIISGYGLREGLVFEYVFNNYNVKKNVLDFSLDCIMTNLNLNKNHSMHVYNLTLSLFNQLSELHCIEDDLNNVIKTACFLHDCGTSISYYDHHKHSFYIMTNSRIRGLSHRELLLSAFIAANHRKGTFSISKTKYKKILSSNDERIIKIVSIMLRLSESLDKNLAGSVKDISCKIDNETVFINLISEEYPSLEIIEAQKNAENFKELFNKKLVLKHNKSANNLK